MLRYAGVVATSTLRKITLLRPLLPRIDAAVHLRLTNLAKPNWKLLVADDDLHAARGAARAAVEG